jgi:hypothetical protein
MLPLALGGTAGVRNGIREAIPFLTPALAHRPWPPGTLLIEAAGQVIELPAQVLVGQREELAHGRGAGRPQGPEQPGHDAPEQLVRLQVHGRPCQPWVTLVQERAA